MNYCVYLTTYSGNKLPPFYIGSTSIQKIHEGYRGSVKSKDYQKIWSNELKTKPHLFKSKIIKTFNTRQEAFDYEQNIHNKLGVVHSPLYTNRAAANGQFSNHGRKFSIEHKLKISQSEKGKIVTPETRLKQSISHQGQRPWMIGSKRTNSTKSKISQSVKMIDYGTSICPHCGREGKNPSIHKHIKKCA